MKPGKFSSVCIPSTIPNFAAAAQYTDSEPGMVSPGYLCISSYRARFFLLRGWSERDEQIWLLQRTLPRWRRSADAGRVPSTWIPFSNPLPPELPEAIHPAAEEAPEARSLHRLLQSLKVSHNWHHDFYNHCVSRAYTARKSMRHPKELVIEVLCSAVSSLLHHKLSCSQTPAVFSRLVILINTLFCGCWEISCLW